MFAADGAYTPQATRFALAAMRAPVLLMAGELDVFAPPVAVTEYGELFKDARLVVQSGAGHRPWLAMVDVEHFVGSGVPRNAFRLAAQ